MATSTTALDPSVAAVLDRRPAAADSSEDEDDLIAELEKDDGGDGELAAFREQRLQQLHAEYARAQALRSSGGGHGTYTEIRDEKAVLEATTSTRLCVVHFFKPDFHRCGVMDAKLEELAPRHYEARFLRVNVENAAWLVARLKVQVLPCVIAFVDGVGVDRVIGFEGLGTRPDSFTTRDLEARLLKSGVLVRAKLDAGDDVGSGLGKNKKRTDEREDDDSGDDWD